MPPNQRLIFQQESRVRHDLLVVMVHLASPHSRRHFPTPVTRKNRAKERKRKNQKRTSNNGPWKKKKKKKEIEKKKVEKEKRKISDSGNVEVWFRDAAGTAKKSSVKMEGDAGARPQRCNLKLRQRSL
ncbi:unnamed protein product [Amoebophrya sp. A120]|nr:unnamed protein product [Amoebophrya sp. A120]|eukprot:GSA120T00022495001.1